MWVLGHGSLPVNGPCGLFIVLASWIFFAALAKCIWRLCCDVVLGLIDGVSTVILVLRDVEVAPPPGWCGLHPLRSSDADFTHCCCSWNIVRQACCFRLSRAEACLPFL
ncbi:hypothetical protein Nepgr_032292 [Nepenthes gracilis]|uniref:Uncharacterized protein n=1 Tax=Nepenthes gracilis TaxID=150966 RepID=A0AAD3Y7S2_NEPGR|nr:hypothetical protein Nepgr_032292 [Nepenthes gracilis]